jgi:hypothetical protein
MNLADVFTFLFVILGFVIVFVCYWLMAAGLFPEFVARSSARLERSPLKMLGLGAVTLVPLIVLGFALSAKAGNGVLKITALSLVMLPLLAALFGSAGWAQRVGAGLKSTRDESEPWRRVLRGGIVVGIAFVLPFIGTFVMIPFVFLSGFGAFLAACRQEKLPQVSFAAAPVAASSAFAPSASLAPASEPVLTQVG